MKYFIIAAMAFAISGSSVAGENWHNTYENYQSQYQNFWIEGSSVWNYECAHQRTYRNNESGMVSDSRSVSRGTMAETIRKVDGVVIIESTSYSADGRVNSMDVARVWFENENTKITSGSFSWAKDDGTGLESKTYYKKMRWENGLSRVIEWKEDGAEKPYNKDRSDNPLDPFGTRYFFHSKWIDPNLGNTDQANTRIAVDTTCLYERTDITSYKELIPDVIVGTWKPSHGTEGSFLGNLINKIELRANGTVKLYSSSGSDRDVVGKYTVDGDKVEIELSDSDNTFDRFVLRFNSINDLEFATLENTSLVYVFKRD